MLSGGVEPDIEKCRPLMMNAATNRKKMRGVVIEEAGVQLRARPDSDQAVSRRFCRILGFIQRLIIPILASFPLIANAAVYKCTGPAGEVFFSDQPCGTDTETVEVAPPPVLKGQESSTGLRPGEKQWLESIQKTDDAQKQKMREEQEQQARRSKDVLGTMVFMFHLAEERAVLPPTSMDVTLVIVSRDTDHQYRQKLVNELQRGWSGFESASWEKDKREGHFNFSISLPSGEYLIDSVEIMAPELDRGRITLPVKIGFTVPAEAECVYIGRTLLRFYRLAPGRYSEQRQRSKDVVFVRSGGFVPILNTVDIPALDEQLVVRLGKELYQEARQRNCIVQPAVP